MAEVSLEAKIDLTAMVSANVGRTVGLSGHIVEEPHPYFTQPPKKYVLRIDESKFKVTRDGDQ